MPYVVGLTGGIGCGKSKAADFRVLMNDTDIDTLRERVRTLHERYLAASGGT